MLTPLEKLIICMLYKNGGSMTEKELEEELTEKGIIIEEKEFVN